MMIQSTESGLFGMNRVDRTPILIEQTEETEEPVAPNADRFQRESIKYHVRDPEPLYKLDEYASLSDLFGAN